MNEQFNWYKNHLVHKGIQHLHVSEQATKISEIRLHYLGYKNKIRQCWCRFIQQRELLILVHVQTAE